MQKKKPVKRAALDVKKLREITQDKLSKIKGGGYRQNNSVWN